MTAVLNDAAERQDRDRRLVERHQAGDRDAFAQLYALHYGRLVRFCIRFTRDNHTAEEVAQEAFTRAFASLDRLQGERRFYPWLTVIARRVFIDLARKHAPLESRPDVDRGAARAAEDVAVHRIDSAHVAAAVHRLSERHQEVLRLRDRDGLSYDAIAEHLGVAPTTIPPLLHRARAALRREYVVASRGRVASWLHLAALWASARRLRDRMAVWIGHFPDPGVFAAPVAGAILGAAVLLAPQMALEPAGARSGTPASAVNGEAAAPHRSATAPGAGPNAARPRPQNARIVDTTEAWNTAGFPQEDYVVPGVIGVYSDPDTLPERQERTRRMPIYYENEQTGIGFAADPPAMVRFFEDTLASARPQAATQLGRHGE